MVNKQDFSDLALTVINKSKILLALRKICGLATFNHRERLF